MIEERETSPRLLTVLIVSFGVLILLLAGAAYVAIGAIESVEAEAEKLVTEEQATVRLIDEVQGVEGNLSAVFYSLARGGRAANQAQLLARLDNLEAAIDKTTAAGIASGGSSVWGKVRTVAAEFIAEGRGVIRSGGPAGDAFYLHHQNLIDVVAELASANFVAESLQERLERERAAGRVRSSLILLAFALLSAAGGAVLTVRLVNRMFRRLEWQASELAQLSSRTMSDQEDTAQRFSHEMHDHFGQTLSAIEANLVAMQHSQAYKPDRLEDCLALVKDAVDNVREMSQLLRPSILDDFGLDASLRWLADSFSDRTGIHVEYRSSFEGRLDAERETQLFRIAQEALTNVARHAKATEVRIELATTDGALRLTIADNGRGFREPILPAVPAASPATREKGGLGLVGMRARARAVGGTLKIDSIPEGGVCIVLAVPRIARDHVHKDTYSVG